MVMGSVRWAVLLSSCSLLLGQSAQLSGVVIDPSGSSVGDARVELRNRDTGVRRQILTNQEGFYSFISLKAGIYQATLSVNNFRTVTRDSIVLNVGDSASLDFTLQLARADEQITVIADHAVMNPLDPAVSTVVDQEIVQNMPLNGRSFQSLIALSPGVVFTSQDIGYGQFSANGQRSNANYFMVDGVSANFGLSRTLYLDQTLGGAVPGLTADGGTNGLVSADAMQEFRIQTSTYAPEFGRTPGASISILTKSGTNQFHGTAFNYLRNDILDARNFFNTKPQPQPPLRQNDFGGTLGGPLRRNKTFFFLSYEGLRLRLPQTDSALFYTPSARAAVAPAYQPFVNALPLPSGPAVNPNCDNIAIPCLAPLTAVYSDPSSLDATSIRVDHTPGEKVTLFARYNHAPSASEMRSFNQITSQVANTDTLTGGATFLLSSTITNEFRGNWSEVTAAFTNSFTNEYGALVPPDSLLFPSPFSRDTSQALVSFPDVSDVRVGRLALNYVSQVNFVNTLGWTAGTHQLKFGLDYRTLSPSVGEWAAWSVFPSSYASLVTGTMDSVAVSARDPLAVRINNYSLFSQDTWRLMDRLTLTYGLRWEINTPPVSTNSENPLYVARGVFDSGPLAMEPGALWRTRFGNLAPRFGAAYRATPQIVIRGGLGIFYDLGYGSVGAASGGFPYNRYKTLVDSALPFNQSSPAFQLPPSSTGFDAVVIMVPAVDPNLDLPFTIQWNTAIELALGANQALAVTYVGSDGRRLLRQAILRPPEFGTSARTVMATLNSGSSHYNALQAQFQRRMSNGLQALFFYNLAKSSDDGSSDISSVQMTASNVSQVVPPPLTPSDFDIRHSLSGAFSYEMVASSRGALHNAFLKGWALDGLLRVSSPPPINVLVGAVSPVFGRYRTQPDIVPGQPHWIEERSQPGGKVLNPAAFSWPAVGTVGNFPRNGVRSIFSIKQLDLALRRRFNLSERFKLDLRVEYFNVFNHPMFGAPGSGNAPSSFLGVGPSASSIFGKVVPGYTTNVALGLQNSLHTGGGPRSGQLTLKLHF
jgi:hypothetical protein